LVCGGEARDTAAVNSQLRLYFSWRTGSSTSAHGQTLPGPRKASTALRTSAGPGRERAQVESQLTPAAQCFPRLSQVLQRTATPTCLWEAAVTNLPQIADGSGFQRVGHYYTSSLCASAWPFGPTSISSFQRLFEPFATHLDSKIAEIEALRATLQAAVQPKGLLLGPFSWLFASFCTFPANFPHLLHAPSLSAS